MRTPPTPSTCSRSACEATGSSSGLRAAPLREVPVRRPVGYGYIDLLGAGKDGRIRVIETKLGPFERLVVQGLDYWIWATANAPDLAEWLDLPADAGIDIEYVVAEKTPGHGVIGSYTSGQAEAIQGSIRWRFTTIRDWRGSHAPTVERLPLRTMPSGSKGRPAPRKAGPRWSVRLAHHLAARAEADGVTLGGGVFWPNATDGLEPAAVLVHERLAADGLAHHMIGHVRSSQAFALNLFAPLDAAGRVKVATAAGIDAAEVSEPRFEWSDPEDQLGERTHASPHATQVDVILDCVTKQGTKTALLIEVKLSEHDFNGCSAWLAPTNDRLDVCDTTGPFGNDTSACFQLRNHGREHRRHYDTALGPLTVSATTGRWRVLVPVRRQPADAQRRARSHDGQQRRGRRRGGRAVRATSAPGDLATVGRGEGAPRRGRHRARRSSSRDRGERAPARRLAHRAVPARTIIRGVGRAAAQEGAIVGSDVTGEPVRGVVNGRWTWIVGRWWDHGAACSSCVAVIRRMSSRPDAATS